MHTYYPLLVCHLTSYGPQLYDLYVHVGISLGAMPSPTALAGLPTISNPVGNPSSRVIGPDAYTTTTSSGPLLTTSVQASPGGWKLAATELVYGRSHRQRNQWHAAI